MARTVLTATQLPNIGGVSAGAGVAPDHTNGNIVAAPGPFRSLIVVSNSGSSASLIIRASGYQGTASGAANASYVTAQYQPFATASIGDLTVTLGAGVTTVTDMEVDSERFTQADGSLWLDWSTASGLLVFMLQRPYMP
jgi:hypothetical protein